VCRIHPSLTSLIGHIQGQYPYPLEKMSDCLIIGGGAIGMMIIGMVT
jgi:hypothetical protein